MSRSRKELAAEAETLAAELGQPVETRSLNHARLEELVDGLRKQVEARAGAPASPPAGGVEEPAPPPAPEPRPAPPPVATPTKHAQYQVAHRRSVIARGKIVGPRTSVCAADFPNGKADLDYLLSRGAIVKIAG
jgi:hypothetical protein